MKSDDFSTLFELLPIGAYRSSPDGRQLRANPALVKLDGYQSEAELLAATRDLAREWYVDPQRREQFKAELAAHGCVQGFVSEVYRHKTRERIWVRVHAHTVRDEHGEVLYYEGTVEDITRERQALAALQANERRFRALTELSSEWYWELDADFRFVRLDIGDKNLHAGIERDVLGKTREEVGNSTLSAAEWAAHHAVLSAHQTFHDFELPLRSAGGGLVWHAISGEPVFEQGVFVGYRGIGRDITERKRAQEAIAQLAYHDALTGLPNRRLLLDRLQQTLLAHARSGQLALLLFLDLDNFKSLNDCLGHEAGDQLLQQVAIRLKLCVRAHDTVARLGGDEFVLLIDDLGTDAATAMMQAQQVGEKILQSLRMPYLLYEHPRDCQCSVGAVVIDHPALSATEILKRADRAMYQAKAAGRNTLCIFQAA